MANLNPEELLLEPFWLGAVGGDGQYYFLPFFVENCVVTVPHDQPNSTDIPEMVLLYISALLNQVCLSYNSIMF
jgi:hypothetical protein